MVAPGPFVTISDLASYRNGDVQQYLDMATDLVRDYCSWHIAPSITETITLDGTDACSDILMVPTLYLTNVTNVTLLLQNNMVLDPTTYAWSANGYIRRRWIWWPWEPRSIQLTITHGYDTLPGEVKAVVLGIAQRAMEVKSTSLRDRQMGPFREQMLAQAGSGVTGGVFLSQADKDMLNQYSLQGVA